MHELNLLTSSSFLTMIHSMRYPGGKGKSYHQIINLMPHHNVYIETHLGSGAVLRNKAPSKRSFGIDLDEKALSMFKGIAVPNLELVRSKAEDFLLGYSFTGDEMVYVDPPYIPETRLRKKVYRYDYSTDDHYNLLKILVELPCRVIVSGYNNEIYDNFLTGWNKKIFRAMSHVGLREECLWFNFDVPKALHDPTHLGENFRDRQSCRRRLERLKEKIDRMDPRERSAFSSWLYQNYPSEGGSA